MWINKPMCPGPVAIDIHAPWSHTPAPWASCFSPHRAPKNAPWRMLGVLLTLLEIGLETHLKAWALSIFIWFGKWHSWPFSSCLPVILLQLKPQGGITPTRTQETSGTCPGQDVWRWTAPHLPTLRLFCWKLRECIGWSPRFHAQWRVPRLPCNYTQVPEPPRAATSQLQHSRKNSHLVSPLRKLATMCAACPALCSPHDRFSVHVNRLPFASLYSASKSGTKGCY